MGSNKNLNWHRLFFILSIFLLIFWVFSRMTDVYHFTFIGVVFEILWLPMLALLFVLPVVSFIFWAREKFSAGSFYLYSLLVVVATILFIIFGK